MMRAIRVGGDEIVLQKREREEEEGGEEARVLNKRKVEEEEDVRNEVRDWANLPSDVLQSILHRQLFFLSPQSIHIWAFPRVCRAWCSFSASYKERIAASQPPFLLLPKWPGAFFPPAKRRKMPLAIENEKRIQSWKLLNVCSFHIMSPAVPGTQIASFAHGLQPKPFDNYQYLDYSGSVYSSNGYIIITHKFNHVLLMDPFTGRDFLRFPPLSNASSPKCTGKCNFCLSTLIAPVRSIHCQAGPLDSPQSRIVLVCNHNVLWTCTVFHRRSQSLFPSPNHKWTHLTFDIEKDVPCRFAVVGTTLFSLTRDGRLQVLDFVPDLRFSQLGTCGLSFMGDDPKFPGFFPIIAESEGQLLLVRCIPFDPPSQGLVNIVVYRLEGWKWVKMDKLSNCALFLDVEGQARCCTNLAQWGGKENHVYITGPLKRGWNTFCLDEPVNLSDFHKPSTKFGKWPRPLWMLPASFY